MKSHPDWNKCIDHNGMTMGRCVHTCNGNDACELDCLAEFKSRQMDCPCEVSNKNDCEVLVIRMIHSRMLLMLQQNCVGGCPCDNYPCTETTTAPVTTTILETTMATTTVSSTTSSIASVTTTTPSLPSTTNPMLTHTILVLSTRRPENKPMTVDFDGKNDSDFLPKAIFILI